MAARTWTDYKRAPIRTRVLLQFADGHQIIGRYDPESRLWLDDSHEDIVATNPDRQLKYYRGLPKSKVPSAVNADEGGIAGNVTTTTMRLVNGQDLIDAFLGAVQAPWPELR